MRQAPIEVRNDGVVVQSERANTWKKFGLTNR